MTENKLAEVEHVLQDVALVTSISMSAIEVLQEHLLPVISRLLEAAAWQAKIAHEELTKLGVPTHDTEDELSVWGRVQAAINAAHADAVMAAAKLTHFEPIPTVPCAGMPSLAGGAIQGVVFAVGGPTLEEQILALIPERVRLERELEVLRAGRDAKIWCTGAMSLNARDNAIIQRSINDDWHLIADLEAKLVALKS